MAGCQCPVNAGYGAANPSLESGSLRPPSRHPVVSSLQPAASSSGRTAGEMPSSSSRVSLGAWGREGLRCCRRQVCRVTGGVSVHAHARLYLCTRLHARLCVCVLACVRAGSARACDPQLPRWRAGETAASPARAGWGVRTRVGRAVGQRQVGASAPGPGAEVPLALAAVGARGVVLTLTLQAALPHRAQVSVQVALAPGGGAQRARDGSEW